MSAAEDEARRLYLHSTGQLDNSGGAFDPSEHTAAEVLDYLDGADETEAQRVLDAEAAGKARKSIVAG